MPTKDLEAARASRKKWYINNKEKAKSKVMERKETMAIWFKEYKTTLSCEECGYSYWSCLDFHHNNIGEKEDNIGQWVIKRGYGKERFLEELSKLDITVLCANCHRKLHHP